MLSVDADKTDEQTLTRAIKEAVAEHLEARTRFRLAEYTSHTDMAILPGHYVLFWELNLEAYDGDEAGERASGIVIDEAVPLGILEDCCATIEERLDVVYRFLRVSDRSIGPLEIRVVAPGSFDALMDHCVANGTSIGQYKTPRCLKNASAVELLDSRVTHRVFSRHLPSLSPAKRAQP
jgi:auxin responsive GH3 family protein